jgi:hypothetical protein
MLSTVLMLREKWRLGWRDEAIEEKEGEKG